MTACFSFCHSFFSKIPLQLSYWLPRITCPICLPISYLQREFQTPVLSPPTPTACRWILRTSSRRLSIDSENFLTHLKVCSWDQQIHPVLDELGPFLMPPSNTWRSNVIYLEKPNTETEIPFICPKIWPVGVSEDRDPNIYSTQERSGIYAKKILLISKDFNIGPDTLNLIMQKVENMLEFCA